MRLPDSTQRQKILSIMLADCSLDDSFDIGAVVRRTEGYSGSDLKELCRAAAMIPVREFLRSRNGVLSVEAAKGGEMSADMDGAPDLQTRPLRNEDFFVPDSATPMHPQTNGSAAVGTGEDALD